jgi:hypothetical protein
MGTGTTYKTDLYGIFDFVQNTLVTSTKEIIIENLRNFFAQDSYYSYRTDEWGFAKTPDHTDLPLDAGYDDDVTTRLLITENYRHDVAYYPALLVKYGSGKSRPISMSRNKGVVRWSAISYLDGYGNETLLDTPSYFVQAGAWEGSVLVDIETKSMRSRDELVDLVAISFVDTLYEDLYKSGVVIKSGSPTIGSPTEEDDRNDKIFKQSITFDIYSEWRRHIPITSVVDAINICVDIGDITSEPEQLAPNISIVTSVDVIETIANL